MNLLALDTSTELISIVAMLKDKVVYAHNRRKKYGSSKAIVYLRRGLEKLSLEPKVFDAFVIGAGPGSFTGLRISFSVIKALSMALNKPVISMGSFFSCAAQMKDSPQRIAVISDAKRNLIYGAPFRIKSGKIIREKKEALYLLDDFLREYKEYTFCTYDSLLREKALLIDSSLDFYHKDVWPRANNLAVLAKDYYLAKRFTPLDKLEPLYIYPKDCQVRKPAHS